MQNDESSQGSNMMEQNYTATFGNMNFQVEPSQTGEINYDFATIPYISLESIVYAQQMSAQTNPTNVTAGQNTGQQNIQGSTTVQDGNGLTRIVMGYSPGGF